MLALESPLWSELRHAYGAASYIPSLLRQLSSFPDESSYQSEPWFTLWSSLCHQGDVYPASFAAVPHIVGALALAPSRASMSYFLLPASIEVERESRRIAVPPSLDAAYSTALAQLPLLAGAAARPGWDKEVCAAALAATAAATETIKSPGYCWRPSTAIFQKSLNGCIRADFPRIAKATH